MTLPLRWILLALFALGACDRAGGSAEWAGTIDTLESGIEVVRNPAEGMWDSSTAWRLVEDLRIGSVEGEGPETFAQITDLAVDAAGRIYVLDGHAQEVRVFARTGEYVRTIGRAGAGPGELRGAFGLDFDPRYRLWVADWSNARYSVFDTTGAFLGGHRRPIVCRGFRWQGGMLSGGELYDFECSTSAGGTRHFVARYDSAQGSLIDTLAVPAPSGSSTYEFEFGDTRVFVAVPFTPVSTWTLDTRGFVWSGTSDRYRVTQVDLLGDTVRVVERAAPPASVSPTERQEALASIRQAARGQDVDESRIPSRKPYFNTLIPSADGHLWIGRSSARDSTAFDIFAPDGRFLGTLALGIPTSPWLLALPRGDALYVVDRDELGVQYVVRYRIENRS